MPSIARIAAGLAIAGALLAAAAPGAAAQTRPGAISGVVKDSLGVPIPFVEVTALKAARSVRADSAGRFLLTGLPSANTDVSFRRLAFAPVILMITVPPSDTADVEVTLGVVAQQLTGVVVQERPAQLRTLVAFEARRAHGAGKFVTRDQIEKRQPLRLSDMLRSVPGMMLIPADNGRTQVRFTRGMNNKCPPMMFVDGIEATNFSIDDMPPTDVEGIELYAGPVGLPPEYSRVFGTSNCGTVLIWSRIPGNARPKP